MLSSRIQKLERQNRIMRFAALSGSCLFVAFLVVSCQPKRTQVVNKKIMAEEFVLVDANGKVRGQWAMTGPGDAAAGPKKAAGVEFSFLNANQKPLMHLGVGPDSGGGLTFYGKDANGVVQQHFLLATSINGMQLTSGVSPKRFVDISAPQFSGGHFGAAKSLYRLLLQDVNGQDIFDTADYYGFKPQP